MNVESVVDSRPMTQTDAELDNPERPSDPKGVLRMNLVRIKVYETESGFVGYFGSQINTFTEVHQIRRLPLVPGRSASSKFMRLWIVYPLLLVVSRSVEAILFTIETRPMPNSVKSLVAKMHGQMRGKWKRR